MNDKRKNQRIFDINKKKFSFQNNFSSEKYGSLDNLL